MHITRDPNDYAQAIALLVKKLPVNRAEQLYDFARFLLKESSSEPGSFSMATDEQKDYGSEEELAAEDEAWNASLARHAQRFADMKAQAKADVRAQRTFPMFDEHGEFIVE